MTTPKISIKRKHVRRFDLFLKKRCYVNSRHSLGLIAALAIIYSVFIVVKQCKHIDI